MAEEPAPEQTPPNATADDIKAAAALSSLSTNADDLAAQNNTAADSAALGKAVSNLKVTDGATGSSGKASTSQVETKKPLIKINAEDVKFLVEELDLSKSKATELLRAQDGDRWKAVEHYVLPAAQATATGA